MNILLFILVSLSAIPIAVFFIEVLCSLLPKKNISIQNTGNEPLVAVLIPAHNESSIIGHTLKNITQQLPENGRILVVADNCSDDTAMIASTHGAEVIERTDTENRGKGFALDFGIKHLANNKPDVVIIVDADCLLDEGALHKLAYAAVEYNRPIQALYMMHYSKPSLKQRISEFAWLVKNHVRPLGLSNMGLPCQLMGTGMAFPWSIISKASLASSNIVEDMKMGLDMALEGNAPVFLPDARVVSTFPEEGLAEQSQRKRWEHGHLSIIFTVLPKMFVVSVIKASKDLLAMVLDLIVPPLALLTLITVFLFAAASSMLAIFNESTVFIFSLITLLTLAVSIFIAWLRWGRDTVSFTDLLMVPVYIISKIPLYITALFKRQKEWIRTNRD